MQSFKSVKVGEYFLNNSQNTLYRKCHARSAKQVTYGSRVYRFNQGEQVTSCGMALDDALVLARPFVELV